ncbi:MAG: tetraacyldisaccharide 4'-kinase [Granulosicoccus sp.]
MSRLEKAWTGRGWLACLLWPVSLLYCLIIICRQAAFQRGWLATQSVSLPVVVIGNVSVGGTGKTPLCAFLVRFFQAAGWRPAIVSRGYGGARHVSPHLINGDDAPVLVGDEPLMLFQQTGVPVCVCVQRALAVEHIAAHCDADIVFADDGLQHLAMPRAAEIVVLDGRRGLGNGWMLPAGPLREPATRLGQADVIAVQGTESLHDSLIDIVSLSMRNDIENNQFHLKLVDVVALSDGEVLPLGAFAGKAVIAMAGIGHPQRFFDALGLEGLRITGIPKPDHHQFTLDDFDIVEGMAVLVTSKDAVKLKSLGKLPVDVYEVRTAVTVSEPLKICFETLERSLREVRCD